MSLVVTAFYASLLGLCYVYLSLIVIGVRRKNLIGIGDGDNAELRRVIRVHSNFNEYVPITLILLVCLELNTHWHWMLHVSGCLLLIGRLLHAYGLRHHEGASWQRFAGMIMTFTAVLFSAGANLYVIHYGM